MHSSSCDFAPGAGSRLPRRRRWRCGRALLLLGGLLLALGTSGQADAAELTVDGRYFRDAAGRVVLLRGVNLAGNSKVPPFVPLTEVDKLDQLADWGVSVIRLVFTWEAYEPSPGVYDDGYLAAMVRLAEAAWERGIYTIVDVHQDGYSRYQLGGCGDGFPEWAIPPGITRRSPDNSAATCASWGVKVLLDADMKASFAAFFADRYGVRRRYLALLGRIAAAFSAVPGVIGYDPLNEPWANEVSELGPLYEDAAVAIRAVAPEAILFLEGQVLCSGGTPSQLPRPSFGNFAYAPHFYDPLALALGAWSGFTSLTDRAFATMNNKAAGWNVPLLLGEFGIAAGAGGGLSYVDLMYERLDDYQASGTYWNFTPGWTPAAKDGWNGEDFSLIAEHAAPRPTFRYRPYARRIPGTPTALVVTHPGPLATGSIEVKWMHDPARGQLELYLPHRELWGAVPLKLDIGGAATGCWFADASERTLLCQSTAAGPKRVKVRPCITVLGVCL